MFHMLHVAGGRRLVAADGGEGGQLDMSVSSQDEVRSLSFRRSSELRMIGGRHEGEARSLADEERGHAKNENTKKLTNIYHIPKFNYVFFLFLKYSLYSCFLI